MLFFQRTCFLSSSLSWRGEEEQSEMEIDIDGIDGENLNFFWSSESWSSDCFGSCMTQDLLAFSWSSNVSGSFWHDDEVARISLDT
jgi:hypothetical protein